jgi:hypothetical protein
MINATQNTSDTNWTAWFDHEMPEWTASDTAIFFKQLSDLLSSLIQDMESAAKDNSQEMRQSEVI